MNKRNIFKKTYNRPTLGAFNKPLINIYLKIYLKNTIRAFNEYI